MLNPKIKEYLDSLNADPAQKADELKVSQEISKIVRDSGEKARGEDLYEAIAFDFFPRHAENEYSWGTHYGAQMVFNKEGGGIIEYPSLQQVDEAALVYWEKRARESKHPILVERYADLVVDFSPKILKKPANHELAQKVIDSALVICDDDLVESIAQKDRLRRALEVTLSWNDQSRLEKVKNTIIKCEKKLAIDDKPGLWGFAFKWLVLESDKTKVTNEELASMLNELEERLKRLSSSEDPDPWPIECAVNLLVDYYATMDDGDNVERLLLILENSFRKNKRSNSDGMLKTNYLEKLQALYEQYQRFGKIKSHLDRIIRELPGASKEALDSLQEFSTTFTISNAELKKMVDDVFIDPQTVGPRPTEEIIIRILGSFYVDKKKVGEDLDRTAKDHVFLFFGQKKRMSPEGHTIGIIRPINEDYDSHLIDQALQQMQIYAPFLNEVMARFKETFTPDATYAQLAASPLFKPEEKNYLMDGLTAYWDKDYLKASLAFIPYIENIFRHFVAENGGAILRSNKFGGYDYRSLNNLIEDPSIDRTFGTEISFYFKALLTHPFGWNLRNNFAHGIGLSSFFQQNIADRLLHVILFFSVVRKAPVIS
jgi:hypothetical protein